MPTESTHAPTAQLRQYVGAAAFARRGAVAVFGDRHARPRRDKRYCRADVERAGAVAARPAGVKQFKTAVAGRDLLGIGAHGLRAAHNFVMGLALHAKPHQIRANLRLGRLAGHDLVHDGLGVADAEVAEAPNHVNGALDVHFANL